MIQIIRLFALAGLLVLAPVMTQADEQKPAAASALVILSSASEQTQGMAMVLSNAMAQQGASVSVLLCDQAGDLALRSYQAEPLKPRNVTPGQLLRKLMASGGEVSVCALYLPNSGHDQSDLIDGIKVATPPEIARQMLDPATRTFSF